MKHRLRFVLAVLLLCLSSSSRAQNQNLFFQPPSYPGVGQIVTADFNGDGKADLVSSDGTVLLGNGDGTFRVGTPWSVAGQTGFAGSIAAADFNGDGKQDLVVTSSTFLYVLLGNGDGTFQPAIGTNVGTTLGSLIVADVNNDGKPDVISLESGVFVFLGKGDGSFSPGIMSPVGSSCYDIATGNFNGGNKLDVAVACYHSLEILLGNGDGTFQPLITSTSIDPVAIAAGDVNGDGKPDLVIADNAGGTGETFTLLGNGDGTFQTPSFPVPATGNLVLGDVNGDGNLDLVVGDNPFAEVFLGNGNGSFTLKDAYFARQEGGNAPSIVEADFNNDGKPDIAIANEVLLGNRDGSFQGNSAIPVNQFGLAAEVSGDFNGDGIPDVAAISANNLNDLYILLNNGTGAFSLAYTYTFPQPCYAIATADLNGDGKLDLVVVTVDSITQQSSFEVLLGNGDGSFGAPTSYGPGGSQIVIADFNGDQKPDIAVLGSDLTVFLNSGNGTFGPGTSYFAGSQASSFVVADFNNDGKLDVATAGAAGLGILLGKGDGTFQPAAFPNSGIQQVLAAADVNNDGNTDLITLASLSPGFEVLLGNGDGTFSALPPTNQNVSSPMSVADINGDGKLDIVTVASNLQYFLGNGDGTFGNATPIIVNNVKDEEAIAGLLTADFNHDGRIDIATTASGGLITFLNVGQPPTPGFLISAKALTPAVVTPGSSATSTVTLTDIGGFNGAVALSCTGLPSGASCGFSPPSLSGSPASATLTINTAISTPVGSYPVTVTATSSTLTQSVAVTLTLAASAGATTVALEPKTLLFAQQATGTTSPPQSVELTNTGTASLAISSISVIGTNSGDFIQTNSCGSSLMGGALCQISVTFSPTGTASRSAVISISDNATGSPQTLALAGSGPDFSLAASGTTTATVAPGQTATYTVSLAPEANFNQSVMLSCSGAPAQATCSVSPGVLALNGTSTLTATVTVSTTASSEELSPAGVNKQGTRYRLMLLTLACLGLILVVASHRRRENRRLGWLSVVRLAILVCFAMAFISCGGGSSGSSSGNGGTGTGVVTGTQPGTYALTVSASVGSGSTALTHTMTLSLDVQ